MNRKLILAIIAGATVLVTIASFFVLKGATGARATEKTAKEEIIYARALDFLKADKVDKAINALVVGINQYPESEYVERSLKKLASIYEDMGDHAKARYYYNRLLKKFPETKEASKTRSYLETLNVDAFFSPTITEDSMEYEIQPGDSLYAIAKKFNTSVDLVKKINGITSDVIHPGQKLKINVAEFSILVDKTKNILVLNKDGEHFKTYIVSTGKDGCTPVGVFSVEEKMKKPVWYKMGAVVSPDSEEYELGERWMGLSVPGYGIHGTNDETSIGSQVTQGCVRMYNKDVVELYMIVPSGAQVEIIEGQKKQKEADNSGDSA